MIVNLNVVLFDQSHFDRTKPINVVVFDTTYATDRSREFLENQLVIVLNDIKTNKPIPPGSPSFIQEDDPEIPNGYCMNDGDPVNPQMTGAFLTYYGTPKLVADTRAMGDFRKWIVNTVSNWMSRNGLIPKTKTPPVPDQYLEKIIANVTIDTTTSI